MPTPTIGTNEVYASVSTADAYAEFASHAGVWNTSDDDIKEPALVTATRMLNRQRWKGEKTDPTQELAWPRTSTGIDGVTDTVIPQPVIDGAIELAIALANGSDVQESQNQSQKIASLAAGSVSIAYFRGAEGTPNRWPQIIWELLRDYLEGGSLDALISSLAFGTDGESITRNGFGLTGPL